VVYIATTLTEEMGWSDEQIIDAEGIALRTWTPGGGKFKRASDT